MDIRIPMRFPGCQFSVWCVLSHIHVKEGMLSNPSRERQWKFCVWNFSWILPYALPTSTDFNMYLFHVIDPNHKDGNYQEALWVPLVSFQNRVDLGTAPAKLSVVSDMRGILCGLFLQNLQLLISKLYTVVVIYEETKEKFPHPEFIHKYLPQKI